MSWRYQDVPGREGVILVEQYEKGHCKFYGAMFNLTTSEGRASKAGGDAQAAAYTKVEVGRDRYEFYFEVTQDNHQRRFHLGGHREMISKINPPCLPNYGEALAAHLAMSLALPLNLGHFILEGDSQVVISALQHPHIPQDWRISLVILETIDDIPTSISWNAIKVNRSANFCTHHAARWATARNFYGHIATYPPSQASVPITSGKDLPFFFFRAIGLFSFFIAFFFVVCYALTKKKGGLTLYKRRAAQHIKGADFVGNWAPHEKHTAEQQNLCSL
jgi:hypothetical protein